MIMKGNSRVCSITVNTTQTHLSFSTTLLTFLLLFLATRCEKLRLFSDSVKLVEQYEDLCRDHHDYTDAVKKDAESRKSKLNSKIKKSETLLHLNRQLQLALQSKDQRRQMDLHEQIGEIQLYDLTVTLTCLANLFFSSIL